MNLASRLAPHLLRSLAFPHQLLSCANAKNQPSRQGLAPEKVRDTVYREDDSRARTRSGPRVMAGLRNLSIGALHLAGRRDIAEATRWAGRNTLRPSQILALTP